MAVFGGGNVKLWVQEPQKAHPCAELHLLMYFVSKAGAGTLAVGNWKNPKNEK